MCKLITITKKNQKNDKFIADIIKEQEPKLRGEPDGISVLVIDKENNIKVKRSLENYDSVFKWTYKQIKNAKVLGIHTRQATSGKVNEKNLHFFQSDGYYLAHNGVVIKKSNDKEVGKYYGGYDMWEKFGSHNRKLVLEDDEGEKDVSKNDMCDSYQFLFDMVKPIDKNIITESIEEEGFSGVGVIIDSKKKRLYTFGTRAIPAHTNFKDYIITYSFDPKNKIEKIRKFYGYDIKAKGEDIKLTEETILKGVYRYDY